MKNKFITTFIINVYILLLFTSCLGLSMDIQVNRNESGSITMEYRIPTVLENIGRLDGNMNWPFIPLGKTDFERTVARIDGLKLASFSSRQTNQDYIYKTTLNFDNINSLVKFFGTGASYTDGILNLTLFEPAELNSELVNLIRELSEDKKITIGFKADGKKSLIKVLDINGTLLKEETSTFSVNTTEIFDYTNGLIIQINF